ncbi:MAG: D-alanyl-D-alanine carboxypeptidase family protein [Anaerovoracaceae bacterium]
MAKPEKPDISAGSCEVYCTNTGEVMYSKSTDSTVTVGSLSKFFTAVSAAQKYPVDRVVKISKKAASQGKPSVGLKAGEKVTIEDLINGTVISSGNDSAYALMESVSGSESAFVKHLNSTLSDINCGATVFKEPFLKGNKSKTTVSDLMTLANYAFENTAVTDAMKLENYSIITNDRQPPRALRADSTVRSLMKIDGVKGAVTSTYGGYYTALVYYSRNGLRLNCVISGVTEGELKNDVSSVLKYASDSVRGYRIVKKGKYAGRAEVIRGSVRSVMAYTKSDGYVYIPREGSRSLVSTKISLYQVKAPVKKGDTVGKYKIYVAGELVNTVPVIAGDSVRKGWITSYIGIPDWVALMILLALAVLIVLIIVKRAEISKKRKERERLRREKIHRLAEKKLRDEEEHERRGWRF